jgi:predicted hydrocarbon binding protein
LPDLKPIPDLQRRVEEGSVYEGEERVITFRASTFQLLIEAVRGMAGSVVTKTIFYIVGNAIGRRTFEYSKDAITADNWANVLDGVLSIRGWGRLVSLKKKESSNDVVYECTFLHCIICYKSTAKEPVCDIVRGIFAGWLETYLGKKAQSSVETGCRAMGKGSCVFEVTFAK